MQLYISVYRQRGYQVVKISYIPKKFGDHRLFNCGNHKIIYIRGQLVNKLEIMGDTRGSDVGNNTNDDVCMNIYFNEIKVLIYSYIRNNVYNLNWNLEENLLGFLENS